MAKTWTTPPSQSLRTGEDFVLADVDPSSTPGFAGDKAYARQVLESGRETLGELQEKLFAQSRSGGSTGNVLLVLQATDTAGPESRQAELPVHDVTQQVRRDEETGDHEEDVNAEIAAGEAIRPEVKEQHAQDCGCSQRLDLRAEARV